MRISDRLKKIADLVAEGSYVCDVGTDHGYVPIYLLRENKIKRAIAVDLSPGALRKAEENAIFFHLAEEPLDKGTFKKPVFAKSDIIEFRLSDGLSDVNPGEADCIIIAGMGGILMRKILDAGLETVMAAKELILSPHRNPELIYEFIDQNDFSIVYDEEIFDKGKKYKIIKAERSKIG